MFPMLQRIGFVILFIGSPIQLVLAINSLTLFYYSQARNMKHIIRRIIRLFRIVSCSALLLFVSSLDVVVFSGFY